VFTEFGKDHKQTESMIAILAVKPLGTALVVLSSLFTLSHLRRARKSRAQMTSDESGAGAQENRITRMLLFLSGVSVACVLMELAIRWVHVLNIVPKSQNLTYCNINLYNLLYRIF
jgi:hypothetical protein